MEKSPKLIRRSETPEALEFPLEALDGPITPNELFFVRSHFKTPSIAESDWRLKVEGCVNHALDLSLADLKGMPKVTLEALVECAGNGRASLENPVPGLQWDSGAVGNAVWSGVSVKAVLDLAGISADAVDLVFEGADKGTIENPKAPSGEVQYARSVPREVALSGRAILAYEMNGEPLSPSHGFPVRLLVPGWYGAASVKWLVRILAIDHQFGGYYQTVDYSTWQVKDGLSELAPIGPMAVKSTISHPSRGAEVRLGDWLEVRGAAWTGAGDITKVELSFDGAHTWADAELAGLRALGAWRLWSYQWQVSGPVGARTIAARATDSQGRVQPMERNAASYGYVIDHSVPVEIHVLPAKAN